MKELRDCSRCISAFLCVPNKSFIVLLVSDPAHAISVCPELLTLWQAFALELQLEPCFIHAPKKFKLFGEHVE